MSGTYVDGHARICEGVRALRGRPPRPRRPGAGGAGGRRRTPSSTSPASPTSASPGSGWRDYFRVNVAGDREPARRPRRAGRVVIASSAEVYGAVPEAEQPIAEERAASIPQTPYALTKAAAERLALGRGARGRPLVQPDRPRAGAATSPSPPSPRSSPAIARGEQEPVLKVGNLSARARLRPRRRRRRRLPPAGREGGARRRLQRRERPGVLDRARPSTA